MQVFFQYVFWRRLRVSNSWPGLQSARCTLDFSFSEDDTDGTTVRIHFALIPFCVATTFVPAIAISTYRVASVLPRVDATSATFKVIDELMSALKQRRTVQLLRHQKIKNSEHLLHAALATTAASENGNEDGNGNSVFTDEFIAKSLIDGKSLALNLIRIEIFSCVCTTEPLNTFDFHKQKEQQKNSTLNVTRKSATSGRLATAQHAESRLCRCAVAMLRIWGRGFKTT